MTLDVVRDGILRSKRDELTYSVSSRKRKLRELYAVAKSTEPVPQHPGLNGDVPFDDGEFIFLDANDIYKGRYFDEATLPTRQRYVLNVQSSPPDVATSTSTEVNVDRPLSPNVRRDLSPLKDPSSTSIGPGPGLSKDPTLAWDGVARDRRLGSAADPDFAGDGQVSRASQTTPSAINSLQHNGPNGFATVEKMSKAEPASASNGIGKDRSAARVAGSIAGPGVNPAKAVPESAEDIAFESGPAITSSEVQSEMKGAATVKLPSRSHQHGNASPTDLQDLVFPSKASRRSPKARQSPVPYKDSAITSTSKRFGHGSDDQERNPGLLNINPVIEPASSPSSTVGPYSANTPGINIASTDTSPDHDLLLDDVDTSNSKLTSEIAPSKEDERRKAEHDNLLHSQMKIAHADALARSPSSADAQLRLEEEQAKRVDRQDSVVRATLGHDSPSGATGFGGRKEDLVESSQPSSADLANVADQDTVIARSEGANGAPGAGISQGAHREHSKESPTPALRAGESASSKPEDMTVSDSHGDAGPIARKPNSISPEHFHDELLASPDILDDTMTEIVKHTPNVAIRDETVPKSSRPSTKQRSSSTPSQAERMTTRVSSGAMRHKSVSEILGEKPKSNDQQSTEDVRTGAEKTNAISRATSPLSESQSPTRSMAPTRNCELKDKERSKLSTIIFAKQDISNTHQSPSFARRESNGAIGECIEEEKDYLLPLFAAQASSPPRSQPLTTLLASAHKTLTTSTHYVDFHEQQDCRILKRIYQLQYANRWSLRQMERAAEPPRPVSHWDILLDHMKWMRTDFREESKWKITAAKNVAEWCSAWIAADETERMNLQVRVKRCDHSKSLEAPGIETQDVDMKEAPVPSASREAARGDQGTPDLVPSMEDDPMSDSLDGEEPLLDVQNSIPPAAIFSLASDSVALPVDKTPSSERLLSELPLYEATQNVPSPSRPSLSVISDSIWKLPMVPISKYVLGKMDAKEYRPPCKRSRYEFEEEEGAKSSSTIKLEGIGMTPTGDSAPQSSGSELEPEQDDVALFNPENKHIKDRIHAGHAFRPPWEYGMPSQTFFECRQSSQWTWTEDAELRSLVKEYSFNWSLISSVLSTRSQFASGAERRTPWECFERWITLDSLPADMQKTQYFRAYYARLEAAQRNLMAQPQPQQPTQTKNAVTPVRKRTAQPVRVERRKNTKHLALFDAMRKLAKKRENSLQKQQHAAGVNASRKANNAEATQPRHQNCTPQHLSQIKHERDLKYQERAEAYRQHTLQHRNALLRSAPHSAQQQYGPQNGPSQHPRPSSTNAPNHPSALATASLGNGHGQNGLPHQHQSRSHPPPPPPPPPLPHPPPLPNGLLGNVDGAGQDMNGSSQISMKGMPQAQMQAGMGQQRPSQPMSNDMRLWMESNRIQQEQRRFLQQQQQHGQPHFPSQQQQQHNGQAGPSSSPNLSSMGTVGGQMNMQNNPALMAAIQSNPNGASTPSNNLDPNTAPSSSPHLAHGRPSQNNQPQPLSNGMIPTINSISHQIKTRHPAASPEQISRMASEQLTQYQHRMSQAAMSAAAGAGSNQHAQIGMMNGSSGGVANPQLYAQMMRSHQASQSRGASAGPNGLRPPSRSATPHNQRSGSVQTAQGPNQSPRPPQAQMAGTQ
ncbi:MAG: chromatin modification- protein VID21 [Sclerophora amabilis]|nr:MAG: chromatin modification- protein VID21 [Sclerophora amabilis]